MTSTTTRPLLGVLWLLGFLDSVIVQTVNPFMSIYARDVVDASIPMTSLVVSGFLLSSVFSKIPLGISSKDIPAKTTLRLSMTLTVAGTFIYLFAADPVTLLIGRISHGLGHSILVLSSVSLAIEHYQGSGLTKYLSSSSFGQMAGPILGAAGAAFMGIKGAFLVALILAMGGLIVAMSTARFLVEEGGKESHAEYSYRELRSIVLEKRMALPVLVAVCFSFVLGSVQTYAPLYAKDSLGFNEVEVSLLFFGFYLVSGFTRWSGEKIASKLGLETTTLTALLSSATLVMLMMFTASPLLFALGFVFVGYAHGSVFPAVAIMVSRIFGRNALFSANSVYLTAFDLGQSIGPICIYPVASTMGIVYALLASTIPSLAASAYILSLDRRVTPASEV